LDSLYERTRKLLERLTNIHMSF